MSDKVLLHVCDWSGDDRYYHTPLSVLVEFKQRLAKADTTQLDLGGVWVWFMEAIASGQVQQCDSAADHTVDEYFLDWEYPLESSDEWEVG